MSLLVLPGGMPEALQFATEARLRGRRLVGASSLANDPASEEYDHWVRLPLLNAADVNQQLLSLIDLQAIDEIYVAHFLMWRHVYALLSDCRPGVKLCAPLKADAYGHGINIVAPVLQEAGADYAAVATLDEAIELRELGWQPPILILGNILAVSDGTERSERIATVVRHDLTVTIEIGRAHV